MLYDVAKLVATSLASRGCPLPVVYGPERFADVGLTNSRIVFERPRKAVDVTKPPRSSKNNPPRRYERSISGLIRVFAHSNVDGARVQDHEDMAEQAVDLVLVSLEVAIAKMKTTHKIGSGGFVSAADMDLDELESWPGVVYELPITIQRAVYDRTWAGASKETTSTFGISFSGTCLKLGGFSRSAFSLGFELGDNG
jgi:hypothetical protein